jgi:hypothetical protein
LNVNWERLPQKIENLIVPFATENTIPLIFFVIVFLPQWVSEFIKRTSSLLRLRLPVFENAICHSSEAAHENGTPTTFSCHL